MMIVSVPDTDTVDPDPAKVVDSLEEQNMETNCQQRPQLCLEDTQTTSGDHELRVVHSASASTAGRQQNQSASYDSFANSHDGELFRQQYNVHSNLCS